MAREDVERLRTAVERLEAAYDRAVERQRRWLESSPLLEDVAPEDGVGVDILIAIIQGRAELALHSSHVEDVD